MRNIFSMAALGAALLLASCGNPPPDPPVDCAAAGELQPGCFELTLTSTPTAAAATLDGIAVGETPLTVRGVSGVLTLEVALAGYEPYLVDLDLDGVESHAATLAPMTSAQGTLEVSADVAGGMLVIDDEPVGVMDTMPMAVMLLEGSHRVTVQLAGYVATTQTVSIVRGMATSVDIAVGRDLTGSWDCTDEVAGAFSAEVTMRTSGVVEAEGFAPWRIQISASTMIVESTDLNILGSISTDGATAMWMTTDTAGMYSTTCTR